ncbi:hypothetical protein [Mycobacterium colombiense]|uniref:hypothetical protein n=1 Tax=Mycobacterium colombiense TaxID=339268 RepID=UPI00096F3DBE|nr:hypothetical protein [Mycobacterium colombiense]OMB94510.1 hypothetical protein A5732_13665 [Mycobacterium colombiense]
MTDTPTVDDLKALFDEVQVLCDTLDEDLADEFDGIEDRFSDDELRELLTAVLVLIRSGGEPAKADHAQIADDVRSAIDAAIKKRNLMKAEWDEFPAPSPEEAGPAAGTDSERTHLGLYGYDGFDVRPAPTSTFLGRSIPLTEGFAKTQDIEFWQENKRLQIDLRNFRRTENRDPDPEELKRMLWPKGSTAKGDPYEIGDLADDIAARGVHTPPVIDFWGTAWDGNRRLAACLYILESDEYNDVQKERARHIRVWQTGEHATKDQIDAIVTSLNFGKELKKPWPEYVRARDVYDAYIDLRDIEASRRTITDRDETKIRRRVADRFGIKTGDVTRYCKMVTWAIEFEDYHREQERNENEIESRTADLFQYFYELDAGVGDDKLAHRFAGDEAFRAIVFDLLFDGKIKNFSQVRELRRVYDTPAALDILKEAHAQPHTALGRKAVDDAVFLAKQKSQESRRAGKGSELASIAKWLREDVTLSILSKLDVNVLRDFRDAARAVDGMITSLVDAAADATVEAS